MKIESDKVKGRQKVVKVKAKGICRKKEDTWILVHYQLIRADGSSKRDSLMIGMLQDIDREDLETLWKLVKIKHGDTRPEDEHERVLWGDLKVMNLEIWHWKLLMANNISDALQLETLAFWFISGFTGKMFLRGRPRVYNRISKIGSGPERTEKTSESITIQSSSLNYAHFKKKINEVQMKALADFEDQFETFSGLLAPLRDDLKQLLCRYLSRTPRHHYEYCSEGVNIPMMEG
ncbi:hypothetical protein Tco_0331098 [Tanacetum coccineum]